MAPSYFIEIEGVRYDRELIEMADQFVESNDDNPLSVDAVKDLFKPVIEGRLLLEHEETTLIYIKESYRFSKPAEEWLREHVDHWVESRKAKRKRLQRNRKKIKPLTSITAELEGANRKVPRKRPPIPYQQGYYRTVRKNNGTSFSLTQPTLSANEEGPSSKESSVSLKSHKATGRDGARLPKGIWLTLLLILIPVAFFTGRYSRSVQDTPIIVSEKEISIPAIEQNGIVSQAADQAAEPELKRLQLRIAELEESVVRYQNQIASHEASSGRIKELETAVEEERREVDRLRLLQNDTPPTETASEIFPDQKTAPQIKRDNAAVEPVALAGSIGEKPEVGKQEATISPIQREKEASSRQTQQNESGKSSVYEVANARSAEDAASIFRLQTLVAQKDETIGLLNLRLFRYLDREQSREEIVRKTLPKPEKEMDLSGNSRKGIAPSVGHNEAENNVMLASLPQEAGIHRTELVDQQRRKIAELEASLVDRNLQVQNMNRELLALKAVSVSAVVEGEPAEKKTGNPPKREPEAASPNREQILFKRLDQQQVKILTLESALSEKEQITAKLEAQLEQVKAPQPGKAVAVSSVMKSEEGSKAPATARTALKDSEEAAKSNRESKVVYQQDPLQQKEMERLKTKLQEDQLALRSTIDENRRLQQEIVNLQSVLDAKPSLAVAQPVRVVKELTVLQKKIAETMEANLGAEFKNKNIQFDKERLLVTFLPETSFFKIGDVALKQEVKEILGDFFPKLVDTIKSFDEEIVQIQFQGHSSSYWQKATNKTDAYLKNLGLSILRAESALRFCLELEAVEKDRAWLRKRTVTAGFSDNRPVLGEDNQEDPIRSRRITIAIGTLTD